MSDHGSVDVAARPATPEEIPASAASMAKLAQKAGFEISVTYAKGLDPDVRHPIVTESVAVRMRHPDTRITATWHCKDGKEKYGFDVALRAAPLRKISSPVLRRYLKIRAACRKEVHG